MRQLSSFDAQFIVAEDGRTHAHVCQLTLLDRTPADGDVVDAARIRQVVEERIHLIPPFKWLLREIPFGLDYPVFVDDPDFDLDAHITEEAVPAPGNDEQLGELVGRIASRPLDRSRPLWEMHVIHGVSGDRTALVTKIHHSVVDGVSGIEMLGTLLDDSAEGRDVEPPEITDSGAGESPSEAELLVKGLMAIPFQPVKMVRALPATLRNIDQLPTMRNLPGAAVIHSAAQQAHRVATRNRDGRVLDEPTVQAPRVSISGKISAHRRFAFGTLPLQTIKDIKNAHGSATINDVVVALCAGALRRRLLARGDATNQPLVAMVPISVGHVERDDPYGNHISSLIIPIPTDEADPGRRLDRAHEVMASAKERHKATPATLLTDANHTVPPALFARTARVISATTAAGWVDPPFNVTISNIPGSRDPLYCAGASVAAQYPVNVLIDGVGLSITLLSYQDNLDIGLTADRELVPDVWDLLADVSDELETLAVDLSKGQ